MFLLEGPKRDREKKSECIEQVSELRVKALNKCPLSYNNNKLYSLIAVLTCHSASHTNTLWNDRENNVNLGGVSHFEVVKGKEDLPETSTSVVKARPLQLSSLIMKIKPF